MSNEAYSPDPNAPRRQISTRGKARALDPKWQALHALLKSYLKEHAETKGNVRRALRDALFVEFNERLNELTRIVARRFNSRGVTAIGEALSLRVFDRHASFTKMMLLYNSDDARQGFNWFYTMVLNCMRDMRKSGRRGPDIVYESVLMANQIEDDAFVELLDHLASLDTDALSTEQKAELGQSFDRIKLLPAESQRIAEHVFAKADDLTQEEFAKSIGVSLATFKRRKDEIERYIRGEIPLKNFEGKK